MCGLAAIFAYGAGAARVDRAELLAVRDAMAARGPDGAGAWIAPDGKVGLGHRRLAILDLDPRADQPMSSACGRFRIVFNGEISNFRALRGSLEAAGARLRTTSDTEVILELWARRGPACLPELRGMYAFALWDVEARTLFLARDPFGIKPLYLADDGRTVRAASQVKALLAGGAVARELDPAGLAGSWLTGSVPEPFTIHSAIRAVPAGHLVRIDAAGVHPPEPFAPLERLLAEAEDAAPADPREAFLDNVRHHLVADVPVAVFLSAGIDSGAILAALHALDPELAQRTTAVTVTFPEFRGGVDDEAPSAAELARRYGVRHRVVEIEEGEFRVDLEAILAAMDQPSIDGVNSWIVAEATARAGFKVALSGTGGDELLASYPSFRDVPRWHALARVPGAVPGLPRLARFLVERLAPGLSAQLPKLPGGSGARADLRRRLAPAPRDLPAARAAGAHGPRARPRRARAARLARHGRSSPSPRPAPADRPRRAPRGRLLLAQPAPTRHRLGLDGAQPRGPGAVRRSAALARLAARDRLGTRQGRLRSRGRTARGLALAAQDRFFDAGRDLDGARPRHRPASPLGAALGERGAARVGAGDRDRRRDEPRRSSGGGRVMK
ncbi:MAG: hypothetical protein KatS3mg117_3252 [Geminicoccaceae bacterium]|nr:MAG: hypothetical protein KatS3mg117_3252 [Geminicoccaceae bacterium]